MRKCSKTIGPRTIVLMAGSARRTPSPRESTLGSNAPSSPGPSCLSRRRYGIPPARPRSCAGRLIEASTRNDYAHARDRHAATDDSVTFCTANGVAGPQVGRTKVQAGRSSTTCSNRGRVANRLPAVAHLRARRDRHPALLDDRSHYQAQLGAPDVASRVQSVVDVLKSLKETLRDYGEPPPQARLVDWLREHKGIGRFLNAVGYLAAYVLGASTKGVLRWITEWIGSTGPHGVA